MQKPNDLETEFEAAATEAPQLSNKESLAQVFPVNFSKFVRTHFMQKTAGTSGVHKDLQEHQLLMLLNILYFEYFIGEVHLQILKN